ncbi:ribosomal protein S18-alanine N-acetyltransferase [Aeromicrobium sp. IC_218]|uniref:ribosomal protein S18-alanine N-acetyltransferase n=1 Tax=Aeromicrobium sp. IC_218 TaxID=2545468 RepID=UPI00103BB4A1|nr:ribosomal protein S18-alanine N-acetyltransferase [Aeromicrobium sp. IC_218]TCI97751.1 ribosomal-protein-alanine N-acetyltransferase [Aeromicrobium sp. IC_218]
MIRPATADDLDAVVALEQACFGAEAWSAGLVADELASPSRAVLVHDEDGVRAYGTIGVVADVADLHRIATHPRSQGHGLGRALLDALLTAARAQEAERMLLEVAATNEPARRLYERAGFATIATRRRYYASGADALVMERALAPGAAW